MTVRNPLFPAKLTSLKPSDSALVPSGIGFRHHPAAGIAPGGAVSDRSRCAGGLILNQSA